jgi:hypothetical protein
MSNDAGYAFARDHESSGAAVPRRAICERCRHPRPLHRDGEGQCSARGCHGGPDNSPCQGFAYGGIIIATGRPWPLLDSAGAMARLLALGYAVTAAEEAVTGAPASADLIYFLPRHVVKWTPAGYEITVSPTPVTAPLPPLVASEVLSEMPGRYGVPGHVHDENGGAFVWDCPGCMAGEAARTPADDWPAGLHEIHCREDRCGPHGEMCSCPCHRGLPVPALPPLGSTRPELFRESRGLPAILGVIELVDAHLDEAAPAIYRPGPDDDPELRAVKALLNRWRRIAAGPASEGQESVDALNLATGGNPRKGVVGDEDTVLMELGDTVTAALLAIQSVTKDTARTWNVFLHALAKARSRVPEPVFPPASGMTDQDARDNGIIG